MKIYGMEKAIVKLLIIMIEDFKKEKRKESKNPTLGLMLKELKVIPQ